MDIELIDSDATGINSHTEDDLIDRFVITVSISVNATVSQRQMISGVFNTSQIELSYRLTCLPNFTGPLCDKVCTDDCSPVSGEPSTTTTPPSMTIPSSSNTTITTTTSTNTEEEGGISETAILTPVVIVLACALAVVVFVVVCLCVYVRQRSKRATRFAEVVKYVSDPGSAQVVVTGNEMNSSYTLADASTSGHVIIASVSLLNINTYSDHSCVTI